MSTITALSGIGNILCPTDLSPRSQRTLSYATQIATVLGARLTAFHSTQDTWPFQANGSAAQVVKEIEADIRNGIVEGPNSENPSVGFDVIVEKSTDPSSAIPRLARELGTGLIVMKARPGVLSALHFGSIVERVASRVSCPVLLMPSRFLAANEPALNALTFRQVLFDYDFSQATDELFHLTNALARNYAAELHMLSVLEPPASQVELTRLNGSRTLLESAVQKRLSSAIISEGRSPVDIPTTIEWGRHSDKVLKYAAMHDIDLICTALPAPDFYLEKFYRTYLGQLLSWANCPILVKQCL